MIALKALPKTYIEWNEQWGAPDGRITAPWTSWLPFRLTIRSKGPFAWQTNSPTRRFEFPWAYDVINKSGKTLDVLEIGGGLSGLQFVLASQGHRVTNVDPGQPQLGWTQYGRLHGALCRAFRAPVRLAETTIGKAAIPDSSADVLLCVSALEHFSQTDLDEFFAHAARVLRPLGIVVLTVDLFLDLQPFCSRMHNTWGTNIDIAAVIARSGLELVEGNPAELNGFPEFERDRIQARLGDYLIGTYPVVTQCLVARPRQNGR